jgi:NAD+ synthase (glutamine-hydrolysing)
LGPSRVVAATIASRFTDPRSTAAAIELAATLGVAVEVIDLEPLHAAAEATLSTVYPVGTTAENIQARLRMVILMALVNAGGGFLCNTSNKTELALGYGTLYGDLAGALCPIGDLTKPQVYELARWIDGELSPIPAFVLDRRPTAELARAQVDPFDYATLGPVMEKLVTSHHSNAVLRRTEHKRRQAGVILKLSSTAFGSGRIVPISRR